MTEKSLFEEIKQTLIAQHRDKEEIDQVEVNAKKDHKDSDHTIDIGTVIIGDGGIFDGKPTGTCGTEGIHQAVKERHSTQH